MAFNNASEDCVGAGFLLETRVRLCRGKSCRKHQGPISKLENVIDDRCRLGTIKCQGFCKGPVAVVERTGERFWFTRLRGKELRRDLDAFVDGGRLSKRLKRRLKKQC